ncbi:MAG TPA: hypothetical protein VKZ53_16620 [Candidatus Angelobacter sp.]|nr:hypothetical protein [Candidatus Angelobacter sp.]
MTVTLNDEEEDVLREIIEACRRELLWEISRTSHHEFKEGLKHKELLLEAVLNKMGALGQRIPAIREMH